MASIPARDKEFVSSSHQQQGFWTPLRQSKGRSGYFPGYKAMKAVSMRRTVKQPSLSRSYLKSLFELYLEIYFALQKNISKVWNAVSWIQLESSADFVLTRS
jgi:hypothetical protein